MKSNIRVSFSVLKTIAPLFTLLLPALFFGWRTMAPRRVPSAKSNCEFLLPARNIILHSAFLSFTILWSFFFSFTTSGLFLIWAAIEDVFYFRWWYHWSRVSLISWLGQNVTLNFYWPSNVNSEDRIILWTCVVSTEFFPPAINHQEKPQCFVLPLFLHANNQNFNFLFENMFNYNNSFNLWSVISFRIYSPAMNHGFFQLFPSWWYWRSGVISVHTGFLCLLGSSLCCVFQPRQWMLQSDQLNAGCFLCSCMGKSQKAAAWDHKSGSIHKH